MSRSLRIAAPLVLGLGALLFSASPARAAMSAPPTIARLVNGGLDADAAGKAKHEVRRDRTRFSVEVEKLPAGRYELRVGGAEKAALAVNALGRGKAEFSTRRSGADRMKLPLDFDPSGQLIEVAQGGSVFLSVVFPNVTGDGGGTGGGTGGSGGGSGSGGGVGNGGGVPADQRTRVDLVSKGLRRVPRRLRPDPLQGRDRGRPRRLLPGLRRRHAARNAARGAQLGERRDRGPGRVRHQDRGRQAAAGLRPARQARRRHRRRRDDPAGRLPLRFQGAPPPGPAPPAPGTPLLGAGFLFCGRGVIGGRETRVCVLDANGEAAGEGIATDRAPPS
ncbi:MAG: hypothetical protein MUF27_13105 [Acidobacteria bacterium]|nr:hypothetical protein [Acidobacteriota bacterium]